MAWIWLDDKKFPEYSAWSGKYCIAEFTKSYEISKGKRIKIKICADTRYLLFINGKFLGRGPAYSGGDYLEKKASVNYFDEYDYISDGKIEICALVTSAPTVMCELSTGQSGLFVELSDENGIIGESDKGWKCALLSERIDACHTDYTIPKNELQYAKELPNIYNMEKSPLEHLFEEEISASSLDKIDLNSNTGYAIFDKIYSAYPEISIKADGRVRVCVECAEKDEIGVFYEEFVTNRDIIHTSPRMRSVGQIKITLENIDAKNAFVDSVKIVNSIYPIKNETHFKSSDILLDKIFDLCTHTLKICRRDLHLDSPTHQEPLACTGDYYIQSLMEYMNMYDPTLTAFDILRTVRFLKEQDGKMFHTSYSLILPEWLYDYYMHTGDKVLIEQSCDALCALLLCFDNYVGENGLLERAPNYMFVDWILMDENGNHTDPSQIMSHGKMDGYSMHHPPKALGQSVLCMFYYNALLKCAKLFELLNKSKSAKECLKKAQKLKTAINTLLYDKQKELYVGGLNTPNEIPENQWLPKNTQKLFYLKQANILAVLYGVAPAESRAHILEYVLRDLKKEELQPYFFHFLLSALINENMFGKYGLDLIRRYESLLERCDKGLCEAWEMFPGDCSHAWGGAPAYALKKSLSGFEMLEPNYKRVKLNPQLFDLDFADFAISTPYGPIEIKMTKTEITVTAPDEIQIETEK